MMNKLLKNLVGKEHFEGAYSIRTNGKSDINSNDNIKIVIKEDKPGIDVYIKEDIVDETLYIPVIVLEDDFVDKVYNDFYIGKNTSVTIISGCGIDCNSGESRHGGIHTFHLEDNSYVTYKEKHIGMGKGNKSINPTTIINMKENSIMEMESIQLRGVTNTNRKTIATLDDNAVLYTKEIILTDEEDSALTDFKIDLNGENSKVTLSSRSVAKGNSKQVFTSIINGNNKCIGHSECDAIIMDNASVKAVPDVTANHVDASLIHEAAIGKIAKDQILKLMTLGLSEKEAEDEIINGFLK